MKWPNRVAFLLIIAPLVPSCVQPALATRPPAPANSGNWSGSEAAAYRSGHSDGSKDKRQGRAYNPRPDPDQAGTRDYHRGYGDGYRNPNDNPWSQHRAYGLGMQQGHRDKLAGLSMDPGRRLAKEVPQTLREHFKRGYREGWRTAQ